MNSNVQMLAYAFFMGHLKLQSELDAHAAGYDSWTTTH